MRTYRKWSGEIADTIDELLADGWTQQMIADHPKVNSTQPAVAMFLKRRREPPAVSRSVVLPAAILNHLRKAAKARGTSRLEIATAVLSILGADTTLLDNILDDGVTT